MERVSFDPILPENPKVFILGTMPGKQSLKKQQYYANNRNSFWKIIYELTDEVYSENYTERIDTLKKNNIAIWDICQFGERVTSLDSDIKNEVPNPINEIIEMFPSVKQIIFNGKKAEKLYDKYFIKIENIIYETVLSTSPANARFSFKEKLNNWKIALV
ncbi:DNA-deoxyinosine glycosylase [Polaribacter glomeratus]|uniref:DNA-deoxyinosine glycosylase n=1 Tax=Polaribacter glomeratus TaxID=102 RepID=A0A2S7WYI1_9FLAO|nr:DNA-deoxyinosine glycosylase [Polaribacter glomeratus]PQJ82640.1 DNA-deoxyinosine glycosylase [Polaribacter glomeratus]TXD64901.1 DNA-deoxyinosine glycosylase [Polaribacter glomeratus]